MSAPQQPAKPLSPIRDTDATAIALAHKLITQATFAALAFSEPETGMPLIARIGIASGLDHAPIMLISDLASHTKALYGSASCSLLVGEPGKGDPLAHPRMSLTGMAKKLPRDHPDHAQNRDIYLKNHPKSALYLDFADFSFWQFTIDRALLNGGFGKAYLLNADDFKKTAS